MAAYDNGVNEMAQKEYMNRARVAIISSVALGKMLVTRPWHNTFAGGPDAAAKESRTCPGLTLLLA